MSESVQSFKMAPMSGRYRLLTWAYLALVAAAAFSILVVAGYWPQKLLAPVMVTAIVALPGSSVFSYRRPLHVEIRDRHLRFVALVRQWDLELSTITGVQRTTWEAVGRPRRVLGTWGLFGMYGVFRNPNRDWYRAYVTRSDGIVMMTRRQRPPLLLTPDDPDAFVRAIEDVLRRRRDRDARLRELST